MNIDFGTAKGLAQSMDYNNRIADARYQDQQMKRAQAENTAELKAFEDDLDYMNAANSYDYNLIKGEADKTIREIGTIIRDNPDFRYNPNVRRQINEKKKYLKSNQNVIRGLASDESFKRLNDDLAKVAKNPNQYDAGAYQELLAKKQNYLKYGHQDGQEAAATFGPQAFVYDKPEDFIDLPTTAIEVGNKTQTSSKVGRMWSGRSKKPVLQYTKEGTFVKEWKSIVEAAKNSLSGAAAAVKLGIKYDTFRVHAKRLGVFNPNPSGKGITKPINDDRKFILQDILEGKHPQYSTGKLKKINSFINGFIFIF
jgi:hypothetical protein